MLVVRVFANRETIGEIHIQQTEQLDEDLRIYRIRIPQGLEDRPIVHRRADGWVGLVHKATAILGIAAREKKKCQS